MKLQRGTMPSARRWMKTRTGALWLLTLMCLCSCAAPEQSTRHIVFNPPAELLEDVRIPEREQLRTVGDMARLILEDEQAMRLKNADLKALRDYRDRLLELEQ